MKPTAPPPEPVAGAWRRTLVLVTVGFFTTNFTWSFTGPFAPLFMHNELGVRSGRDLAFWTGMVGGGAGLAIALASPIWGALADAHGRKVMLVRSMAWGGLMTMVMGAVQTAPELLAARFVAGIGGGSQAAATALVAAEIPRPQVGAALGVLASARSLGQALGPLVGGIGSALIGFRAMFLVGGAILLLATVPQALLIHERYKPAHNREARLHARSALASLPPPLRRAILGAIGSQLLSQFAWGSVQQLMVLKILELNPHASAFGTGLTYAVIALSTAAAAVAVGPLAARTGYRRLTLVGELALALSIAFSAFAPSLVALVLGSAAIGIALGFTQPTLSSLVGLEAPNHIKATLMGLSSSAVATGIAVGPLMGGIVASLTGLSWAFLLGATSAVGAAAIMFAFGREPDAEAGAIMRT